MAARGQRDIPFETRLADHNISRGGGDHLAAIDQEGFGGIGADRDLAGDGQGAAIEHAVGNFDAAGIFGIKPLAVAKVEQPRLEPPFLVGQGAAAGDNCKFCKPSS